MIKNFNRRLKSHETLLGTMLTLSDPIAADMLSRIGFDWLFVDCEHSPIPSRELLSILQAAHERTAVLVRVPAIDSITIKHALDLGANGVIVPQVNTEEQARRVVEYTRYPPLGRRGIGCGRAHEFGETFDEYTQEANDRVSVVIQAEHIEAAQNIDSIIQTPGIDAILVGPYDLSASLGVTGQVDHPTVVEAIQQITEACQQNDVPLGIFGMNASAVQPYAEQGFNLLVAGIDIDLMRNSATGLLNDMRSLSK